jgi:phosphoribosylformylglycinamidine (FGAM) synthase PurS component
MIVHYSKSGFPDPSGQAVQLEIHLSRLIGVDRRVQAGRCLLLKADQYSLELAVIITDDKKH